MQGTHEAVERFQALATFRGAAKLGSLEQQKHIRSFAALASIGRMQQRLRDETTLTEASELRLLRNTIVNALEPARKKNLRARIEQDQRAAQQRSDNGEQQWEKFGRSKVRKLNSEERKQLRIDRGEQDDYLIEKQAKRARRHDRDTAGAEAYFESLDQS